jgi:hypothetical protein
MNGGVCYCAPAGLFYLLLNKIFLSGPTNSFILIKLAPPGLSPLRGKVPPGGLETNNNYYNYLFLATPPHPFVWGGVARETNFIINKIDFIFLFLKK